MGYKHIRIDAEVFAVLQELSAPGETPNTVLRRLLELPEVAQGRRSNVLRPFVDDDEKQA